MISAHLPPGTKVERLPYRSKNRFFDGPKLSSGEVYTLDGYCKQRDGELGVYLAEIKTISGNGERHAFARGAFRVVQLPSLPAEILACLNVDPEQARVLMPEDA